MLKKIQKIGNSRGIVLDRALLDHLGVANGGTVEIVTESDGIYIRRDSEQSVARPAVVHTHRRPRPQPFEEAMEATFNQYGEAMKRLAE
ncbi:MAG TPA: hypothetical protein VKT77_06025 [Chthonomonadaceae bacterium]|nr:hypothetical protein [Chthonomonadaceae bacterium]